MLATEDKPDYIVSETSKLHWTVFNSQVRTEKRFKLVRSDGKSIQKYDLADDILKQDE